MGVALGELLGNGGGPLPVFQAVDAEEHAHAVGALAALDIHRQHLGVTGGQPGGLGGGGSGQADVDTVCPYLVDDPVQPAKIVHALVRLQLRPGEHRQGQQVDARLAEQTHILGDGCLVPLIGIVIAAIINLFCLQHGYSSFVLGLSQGLEPRHAAQTRGAKLQMGGRAVLAQPHQGC